MTIEQKKRYCFVTTTGQFVGRDGPSGGYPYLTDSALMVHVWPSLEQALSYKESFMEEHWVLKEFVGLNLRDVDVELIKPTQELALNSLGEPMPPLAHRKLAGHHWLEVTDSDGHTFGTIVAQWNPGAQRWSNSGLVATGCFIDTRYYRYGTDCPLPDVN